MDILDARDLFYERNTLLTRQWLATLPSEDQNAIQLLALIFQLNDRHLPGYVHADTPYGIFNYKPEKSETDLARKFNARFKYQQEPVHKNAVIDSLYIHPDLFEHSINIWLFTNARLASSHRHLLAEKLSKIGAWLRGRGMPVVTNQGLIGRVDAVIADAARVQLITDPASEVNVRLQNADTDAILVGSVTGDLSLELTLL